MNDSIGAELRRIRQEKKLTLKEVSERSGLSVSFLSQVERGIRTLTFTSVRKIAEALSVSMNFVFESENPSPIRKNSFKENSHEPHFSYTNLEGNVSSPQFIPARIELKAGESHTTPYTHEGQEFVYVLEGELKVKVEDYEDILYPHESLHIDSTKEHIWYNETDQPVLLLVVSTKE